MFQDQKILLCPLNWGIGHATRMVAYAKQLEKADNTILVAGADEVLAIFKEELPHVERFHLEDIHVHYSKSNKTVRKLLFYAPLFLLSLYKQHNLLKRLLAKVDVDVLVSDNRPSLWNKSVPSYYITHQPSLKLTDGWHWAEGVATRIHQWFIRHFQACLIPDVEGEDSLSGELSVINDDRIERHYIGWLSRFDTTNLDVEREDYTLLILSGVEPSRTDLRNEIVERFRGTQEQLIIAGGYSAETNDNIITLPYVRTEALKPLILSSKHVICRSGYSMLTDLKVLGREAEYIATPGQPEQEYLAKLHR